MQHGLICGSARLSNVFNPAGQDAWFLRMFRDVTGNTILRANDAGHFLQEEKDEELATPF